MDKRLLQLLLIPALICGSGIGTSFAAQEPPHQVRVAINTWMGYAPLYIAREKGFFHGIQVEPFLNEDVAVAHAAYDSGKVDVLFASIDMMPVDLSQGRKGKVFFCEEEVGSAQGIIARPELRTIAQLRGKRVACMPLSYDYWILYLALKQAGLGFRDIQLVEVGDSIAASQAFSSGSVDAAVTYEPFLTQLVSSGKGKILKTAQDFPDSLVGVFLGSEKFLANSKMVEAFVGGWLQGIFYAIAHPNEAEAIAAKAFHMKAQEVRDGIRSIKWATPAMNRRMLYGPDAVGPKIYEEAAAMYQQQGVLKQKPLPASEVFTDQAAPVFERMAKEFASLTPTETR